MQHFLNCESPPSPTVKAAFQKRFTLWVLPYNICMTNEQAKELVHGDTVAFNGEGNIQSRRVLATRTHKNGTVEILIQADSQNGYTDRWYPASAIE